MSTPEAKLWPQLVGPCIDFVLLGVALTQVSTWVRRSRRKETMLVQALAVWVLMVGLAGSVLAFARAGHIFVMNYGNISALFDGVWAQWQVIILFLVHIPTEIFFAERALRLCTRRILVGSILAVLILAVTGLAICAVAIFPARLGVWTLFQVNVFIASATLVAGTDVIITGIIMHGLWTRRDRNGNKRNRRLVRRLAVASAESQLPPSLLAMVICFMDATGSVHLSQMAIAAMSKASVVTFFMVLNTRTALRLEFTGPSVVGNAVDPDVDRDMKDIESGYSGSLPAVYYGRREGSPRTPSLDRCTTAESGQICTLQEVLSDPGSQIPAEELSSPPPTPSLRKEELHPELESRQP